MRACRSPILTHLSLLNSSHATVIEDGPLSADETYHYLAYWRLYRPRCGRHTAYTAATTDHQVLSANWSVPFVDFRMPQYDDQ